VRTSLLRRDIVLQADIARTQRWYSAGTLVLVLVAGADDAGLAGLAQYAYPELS
jgi:hypothetical protein